MNTDEFNPYQAPGADLTSESEYLDPGELRPVPFEDIETEPRFWPRVWAMFSILFRDPKGLADRVPVTGSLLAPWKFMMILGIPVYLFWLAILSLIYFMGAFADFGTSSKSSAPMWLLGLIPPVVLVLLPIMQFLGMLIVGLVNHGCLWIWGGLRQGKELNATIRASGYFFAFFTLISWIPLIGSVAMLIGPAVLGIGLARIHRTDTWRGVCAAYSPLFLCCCVYALFFVAMIAVVSTGAFGK